MPKKKLDKYGNDDEQESIGDIYLFYPISDFLLGPLHFLGFKPNHITLLSTIFTFTGIYFFYINQLLFCTTFYLMGYLLDSIDGRMARKYNEGTTFGMMIDMVSDITSNGPLVIVFALKTFNFVRLILLFSILVFICLFSRTFGINEAIISYIESKDDNFYKYKKKIVDKTIYKDSFLARVYLFINYVSYCTYRKSFQNKINDKNIEDLRKKLLYLKEFGSGNFCLYVTFLMYIFLT